LSERNHRVSVYDPMAGSIAETVLPPSVTVAGSARECTARSTVAVLATPWPQFADIDSSFFERSDSDVTFIDCWRMIRNPSALGPKVRYLPFGRKNTT